MEAISESWRLFTHFLHAQWLCCHTLLPAGFSSSSSTSLASPSQPCWGVCAGCVHPKTIALPPP